MDASLDATGTGHQDNFMKIPKGFCQCGCGEKTAIADETARNQFRFKGQPVRRISGHGKKRHWDKYEISPTGCWVWTGILDKGGYAAGVQIGGRGSKRKRVMRYFYETLIGQIPKGLVLDHLCRTRACVNPLHLEPVTIKENSHRGAGSKLNRQSAFEIRCLAMSGAMGSWIAAQYGVSQQTVCDIKMGRKWV